jgi:hypothetical protein
MPNGNYNSYAGSSGSASGATPALVATQPVAQGCGKPASNRQTVATRLPARPRISAAICLRIRISAPAYVIEKQSCITAACTATARLRPTPDLRPQVLWIHPYRRRLCHRYAQQSWYAKDRLMAGAD